MKKLLIFFLLMIISFEIISQTWNANQLQKANTAATINTLSKEEKEIILYINLARLYPKDFIKNELSPSSNFDGSYKASLIKLLKSMSPLKPLQSDESLFEYAKCFSKEMGEKGTVGHKRHKCKNGNFAECCSYGMYSGKDVVLQLLIDDGVPSLGHRKICLTQHYTKIGVSIHKHKTYGTCAVLDII